MHAQRTSFLVRSIVFIGLALLLVQPRLEAQQLYAGRRGLAQPAAPVAGREEAIAALRPVHKSYWREGGVVTALAAVITHNALVDNLDESYESTSFGRRVTGSIVAAAIGFLPGALIGGLIPKK